MFPLDQPAGESLMRWTVRLAVLMVVIRAADRLRRPRARIPSTSECWLWGIGMLAYLAHVVLAFHFVHDWSHDAAWQHTADETARLTTLRRGEGLWVNYAFTVVWLLDQVRLMRAHRNHQPTSIRIDVAVFGFFSFIVFNATVVFGPVFYRWLAIPAALLLWWSWSVGRRGRDFRRPGESVN